MFLKYKQKVWIKKYMTSGPVIAMVWQGAHAVKITRKLVGSTEPLTGDVGTLKRLQILVSVVLGFLIFKEQQFKQRFLAAILVIAGAVLISMDDLPARITTHIAGWGF